MNIEPFPSRVVLELTPLCNLSCSMCPRHFINDADGYMSGNLFKKLVDESLECNPDVVILPFWRGESCLHQDFGNLMSYALAKGARIHFSTNGHYATSDYAHIFYQCEFVTFSLHTKIGYENAKRVVREKPSDCKTMFQVSFVDSESSTAKYLKECTGDEHLNRFDGVRLYQEHTIGGAFGKSACELQGDRLFCPKLTHTLVVAADGSYSRCNHAWDPERSLNLARATISEVWHSGRMNEIRGGYPDSICSPCDQWGGHTNGQAWQRNSDGCVEHVIYGVD